MDYIIRFLDVEKVVWVENFVPIVKEGLYSAAVDAIRLEMGARSLKFLWKLSDIHGEGQEQLAMQIPEILYQRGLRYRSKIALVFIGRETIPAMAPNTSTIELARGYKSKGFLEKETAFSWLLRD